MKICPYRNAMIKAIIERPRTRSLWGQTLKHMSNAYVWEAMGDGLKLASLTPLATRPTSYALRVDSSWDDLGEHVEEMYQAIEAEYGNCDDKWYPEDDEPEEPPEWWGEWPALNASCGCTWGEFFWPTLNGEFLNPSDFVTNSEFTKR